FRHVSWATLGMGTSNPAHRFTAYPRFRRYHPALALRHLPRLLREDGASAQSRRRLHLPPPHPVGILRRTVRKRTLIETSITADIPPGIVIYRSKSGDAGSPSPSSSLVNC